MATNRTKVSFAESEGRLPAVLKWGELDHRLRSTLWTPIYLFLDRCIERSIHAEPDSILVAPADAIFLREFVQRQHRFVSEWRENFWKDEFVEVWSSFFKSKDYIEVFDFITFLVRDPDCPKHLINGIAQALDAPFSPYRLSIDAKTIFPAVGEEQTARLIEDLNEAFSSPYAGSKSHLSTALKELGDGNYRASVRESIHAVESVVKDYTNDPSAVLSKAIRSLVADSGVHKALADAFEKLYAYASDEKGVRHALVFGENENVGIDEAAFFLSACTAFVGFLSRKRPAPHHR